MTRFGHWLLLLLLPLGRLARAQPGAAAPSDVPSATPADTLYYEATDDRRAESVTDSASGSCTELVRWGLHRGLLCTYYPSGALATYAPYGDIDRGLRHGHVSEWYENGQLRTLQPYVLGQRSGMMLCYYEDGRLRRQAQYEAGRELPGLCYDETGQPVPYFPYEVPPLYPGGDVQFAKELSRQTKYRQPPARSLIAYLPSYLVVSFLVDESGRVTQPRVEQPSLVPTFDQAVLRALGQLSRPWVPGQRDGRPAAFTYRLRLPVGPAAGAGYLWRL